MENPVENVYNLLYWKLSVSLCEPRQANASQTGVPRAGGNRLKTGETPRFIREKIFFFFPPCRKKAEKPAYHLPPGVYNTLCNRRSRPGTPAFPGGGQNPLAICSILWYKGMYQISAFRRNTLWNNIPITSFPRRS